MKAIRDDHEFVHVLLFECEQCGCPVTSALTADARNPDEVDGRTFTLRCHNCDWSGTALAVTAKRHWVDDWRPASGRS